MTVTASTVTATASTRARRREDASAPRPFPWNQSRRRARPSRRARACTHRRDDLDDDASPSDRVRSSTRGYRRPLTRVVTSASSEMHEWERRARASPPHRRTTVTHRASCVARWNTFGTRRVVATTPRAGAGRVPRDASERQFASDGNAWMEINGRVGIVARGAKLTHKCVSPNTRHHGDGHSPCGGVHQAFIPAENQPSPSEQGT